MGREDDINEIRLMGSIGSTAYTQGSFSHSEFLTVDHGGSEGSCSEELAPDHRRMDGTPNTVLC